MTFSSSERSWTGTAAYRHCGNVCFGEKTAPESHFVRTCLENGPSGVKMTPEGPFHT